MAKKKPKVRLTDKQIEQQKLIIPLEIGTELITNLSVLFDEEELFRKWEIVKNSIAVKGNKISISFLLKDIAVEKYLEDLTGVKQEKIEKFLDPDDEEED